MLSVALVGPRGVPVTSDGSSLSHLERTLDPNGSRDEASSLAAALATPSLPEWARHAVPALLAVAFRDGHPIEWDERRNRRHFAPGGQSVPFEFAPRRFFKPKLNNLCSLHHGWEWHKKDPRSEWINLRRLNVRAGTILWHLAAQPVAFSNLHDTYLTPDICQAALHPVAHRGEKIYLHEVLVTQDLPLLEVRRNMYPTRPTKKKLQRPSSAAPAKDAVGGTCIQATTSHVGEFNAAATRAVCAFLQQHGAMGWRNPEDQNEVYLCDRHGDVDLPSGTRLPEGVAWAERPRARFDERGVARLVDVSEAEALAKSGGVKMGGWGGLKLTAGMPLTVSREAGGAGGGAGAGTGGGAGEAATATATHRDGEEVLITAIDHDGHVTLAAQAEARPAHLRLLRTHELQRPLTPAAADTPVEFATYQQKGFVGSGAMDKQGVGPFEQVQRVLKRNRAEVVTGLTGRAALETAQGDAIGFEGRINAAGNFECVVHGLPSDAAPRATTTQSRTTTRVRGPNYRSTEI